MKLVRLMILAAVMGFLVACSETSPTMDLAIENVTLVDAVNPTREGKTVLVNDGIIVEIIDSGTDFLATETIDATGKYLIPGLWDFHVHFTYDARFTDAMAGLFLYHGVTNVRDTGGLLEDLLPVVENLRAPETVAPAGDSRGRCELS